MLHQALFNLISNAVKHSSKKEKPVVEINSEKTEHEIIISVKDNGVGFDMQYVDNYSVFFNVCMPWMNSKEPELGWRLFNASLRNTKDAPGRKQKWIREQLFL